METRANRTTQVKKHKRRGKETQLGKEGGN